MSHSSHTSTRRSRGSSASSRWLARQFPVRARLSSARSSFDFLIQSMSCPFMSSRSLLSKNCFRYTCTRAWRSVGTPYHFINLEALVRRSLVSAERSPSFAMNCATPFTTTPTTMLVMIMMSMSSTRSLARRAAMSPSPTVDITVTEKYMAHTYLSNTEISPSSTPSPTSGRPSTIHELTEGSRSRFRRPTSHRRQALQCDMRMGSKNSLASHMTDVKSGDLRCASSRRTSSWILPSLSRRSGIVAFRYRSSGPPLYSTTR
mmetsp:Transcript_34685/g.92913  ORF Transcript_34685/g.92913 Transcript_34685/m.92913 type:complete len:261 (-) Transcript_34685:1018-1800(-)